MLLPAPPLYPRKRKPRAKRLLPPTPPVVVGPVLVSAVFDVDYASVTLGFDRAIDMSGFVPGEVVLLDAGTMQEFGGTIDSTMLDPQTVRITLIVNGEYAGPGVKLTATGGAGIVASGDSAPWVGVSDLTLPFP